MFDTIVNTDPRMKYSKDPPWDTDSRVPSGSTNRPGAKAFFTFDGIRGTSVVAVGESTKRMDNGVRQPIVVNVTSKDCDPPSSSTTFEHSEKKYLLNCKLSKDGNYTLEINVVSVPPNRFFSFSRIELGQPVITATPTQSSESYPESDPSETTATSQSSSDSSPSDSKSNIGGIVGGVIAALVVLASLLAFILYRKRQVERRRSSRHITPFMASTMLDVPDTPLPTHAAIPSSPPRIHSPPIGRDRSPAILEDELPPPFTAGNSRDIARHGSMYKPRRSVESLPPTEYGYGGGLREWSSENRQSPLR